SQEQGEAEPVHRANAGWQQVGGDVGGQRHQVSTVSFELELQASSSGGQAQARVFLRLAARSLRLRIIPHCARLLRVGGQCALSLRSMASISWAPMRVS